MRKKQIPLSEIKCRRQWRINPRERIRESDKLYNRQQLKKDVKKHLQEEE